MTAYEDIVALEDEALAAEDERQYEAALLVHGRASLLAQELSRPRLNAVLFNRMGRTLEDMGQIQRAVTAYEAGLRALAEDPELELDQEIASLLEDKQYVSALQDRSVPDLYSQATASDLATAEADPALPVRLLINIGNAYLRQPQDVPAMNAYRQALRRPEMAEAPRLRAHALTHVGIIQRRQGDLDEAEAALDEALSLLDRYADPPEKRRALAALAGIYRDRGDTGRALQSYREALALYQQVDDDLGQGRALAGLGRLYLAQGQPDEARTAFERAAAVLPAAAHETRWAVLWGLAQCQRAAGDLEDAAQNLRHSLDLIRSHQQALRTDEGKVTFIESVRDVYDQLVAIHLERARTDPAAHSDALRVAEEARGQAFRDLLASRRRRRSSEGSVRPTRERPFVERWESASQMASGIPVGFDSPAQMAGGIPSGPPPNLEELLDQAAGVVRALDASQDAESATLAAETDVGVPSPNAGDRPADDEAARAIPPVARLIFHVMDDRTAVFAVSPDGEVHSHVVELSENAISQRVEEVRNLLRVDDAPRGVRLAREVRRAADTGPLADPRPLLRELYACLIAPVSAGLPTGETPVVIEPHGGLWALPFAALLGPDDVWMGERWPLLYAPSSEVFDDIRREPDYGGPDDLRALVVGNPTMPAVPTLGGMELVLDPLPGAEHEAQAIAGLFPPERSTLLVGEHADRETVQALMQTHGIIHLATHGIAYADDPLRSFIALADTEDESGLLTAANVSALWLPADLIALSACQTGLGRVSGDGVIGLARAFLTAGARSAVVSLWSVSDEATARLMGAFYQGYLELDDKALALQRAMREVRAEPGFAHPRYWAPFVVVGAEA